MVAAAHLACSWVLLEGMENLGVKMPLRDPDFIPSGTVRPEILSPFLFFFFFLNNSKTNTQQNKTPNRHKLTLKLKQKLIVELLSLGLEADCVVGLTRGSRSLVPFHPE